jgi:hypothetical protein
MLTIKGITNFCYDAVGVLLTSKDDIIVKKHGGLYWIYFKHTRGPADLIRPMWERRANGTKYEKVQLSIF